MWLRRVTHETCAEIYRPMQNMKPVRLQCSAGQSGACMGMSDPGRYEVLGPTPYLWGRAQLQVLHIVCCKVLDHLLGDARERCMVCCDLVNDTEHLEHLIERAVSCTATSSCSCKQLYKPTLTFRGTLSYLSRVPL